MGNKLIVFSGKAQSGKTTACQLLRDYIHDHDMAETLLDSSKYRYLNQPGARRVQIHTFAAPLKDIARRYFQWDGSKENVMLPAPWGTKDASEFPAPDKGRQLLINIGMKFREIRPTIWCDYTFNEILRLDQDKDTPQDTIFTVDDMRFKNELKIMKTFHTCYSVRLHRPKGALDIDDQSEKDLDDSHFDYYIENDGTKADFSRKLAELYHKITDHA